MFKVVFVVLFVLIGCNSHNEFTMVELESFESKNLSEEDSSKIWWNYLNANYSQSNPISKVVYLDSANVCSYESKFDFDIDYKYSECSELGVLEVISFPKLTNSQAVNFVNKTHLFNGIEGEVNTWNLDSTKFEPIEQGIGCYYKIKHTQETTILQYYCGC